MAKPINIKLAVKSLTSKLTMHATKTKIFNNPGILADSTVVLADSTSVFADDYVTFSLDNLTLRTNPNPVKLKNKIT